MKKVRTERSELAKKIKQIMVMREKNPKPAPAYILERGAYDKRGEKVFGGTFDAFPPKPDGSPDNRLGVAQWLTAPNHPLTARVTVNRYWQMIFGPWAGGDFGGFRESGKNSDASEAAGLVVEGFHR